MQKPEKQFDDWMQGFSRPLLLYARQFDVAEAEDIVQDVFLRLFDAVSNNKEPENIAAWLFRVVRNESISRLRGKKRRSVREQKASESMPCFFEPNIDGEIDASAAAEALNSLSLEDREIVVAKIWGDLSFDAIGNLLGQPKTTVFRKYQAALAELKTIMERQ